MKKVINRVIIGYIVIGFMVSIVKPWFRVDLLDHSKTFHLGRELINFEILEYPLYMKIVIAFLLLYIIIMYFYGLLSIYRIFRNGENYRDFKIFLRLSSFLYGLTLAFKVLAFLNDKFDIYRDFSFSVEISSWVGIFFILSLIFMFSLDIISSEVFEDKQERMDDSQEVRYYICRGCDGVFSVYERDKHGENCIEFEY